MKKWSAFISIFSQPLSNNHIIDKEDHVNGITSTSVKVTQGDERKRAMDAFIIGYCLGTAAETAVVIVMKQNHAAGI